MQPTFEPLDKGERHRYLVHLPKDGFLDVNVVQNGVDVTLTLSSEKRDVLKVDGQTLALGPERLWFVAAGQEGLYHLDIACLDRVHGPFAYSLEVKSLRLAQRRDRELAAAQTVLLQARDQWMAGGPMEKIDGLYQNAAEIMNHPIHSPLAIMESRPCPCIAQRL